MYLLQEFEVQKVGKIPKWHCKKNRKRGSLLLQRIEKEIHYLETIQKKSEETIKNAPEGTLRCAINKGYYQYYSGNTYLGENKKDYVKQIAQKEYCLKLNRRVAKKLQKLEELGRIYENEALDEVYRSLHPARKQLVEPIVKPIEEIIEEFESIKYEGKVFSEEDETEYYTVKGERVRSKSEKIIADELYRYQIPYKYEMPIELWERQKKLRFYPDFTVLNKRTGKMWIIEHLGMMDKMSYFENAMRKLDLYERNEILLGKKLILLHETSNYPLSTTVLRKYIETYLC